MAGHAEPELPPTPPEIASSPPDLDPPVFGAGVVGLGAGGLTRVA
jgi:hypothetical protein